MGPKRQAQGGAGKQRNKRKAANGEFNESQSDHEDSAGPSSKRRNQVMLDDDDDDIQGGYEEADGQYLEDIFIPPKYTRIEPPQTGERLVIEKIVCENFKSYGGVKEMGPFHKNFSAIVGPNGNGKSNIIDAMLFVFGYRAAKIRCKKVSVLIHKSELLPSLSSCAVTVHFVKIIDNGKNDDTFDAIPNSGITVTRRAYTDNSSAYWLNRKKVTFQTVASFLKENGIDIVHNRFLILQGEVESIAQMPPKTPNGLETGLLEFLEEVIGTKRYIKPLVELEQRVEQLDYEREEKLHRVDLVEKEKQAMSEPVKKAKDFLRDQNTRSKYQHQILQVKNHLATTKITELSQKIAPVEEKIKQVNDRLEEIKTINETRKKEYEKEEKQYNVIKSDHDKKKKAFDANEAEYVKYYENLTRANEQRKKLLKEKVKKEQEIEKLEIVPTASESEKGKLQKRKEELDELVEAEEKVVAKDMEKLNEKIKSVLKDKTGADKEYNKWLPLLHQRKMHVQELNRDLENYKQKEATEKLKLDQFVKELNDLKQDIQERENQAGSNMEDKIGELERKAQGKERELPGVIQEHRQKSAEMAGISSALHDARESLEGSGLTDQIYKLFIGEKDKGRLTGLYGRLKDLATIDEKYNVAMTVATGMLEYWVVDSDETGTACINLLKERRMPFQNFVCLNRLQSVARDMNRPFTAPRNSKRLFDLLQIQQPEVAPAFYKAVWNTLAAENLDIASEIGYSRDRHRVVTLIGEVIDPSGAMTGGGRQKIVGKMNSGMASRLNSNVSRNDVSKLQNQYDDLKREIDTLDTRRNQLDSEIFQLRNEIKAIKDRVKNFQGDLEGLKKQLPLKLKRAKDQDVAYRAATVDPKVLKQKEQALKSAEAEQEEVIANSKGAENEKAKFEERLQDLQVSKKNDIRKKLDKFLQQRKTVEEEIDKITVDLKNNAKNRKRAQDKLESITKEIETLEGNMRNWKQKREDIEEGSKTLKLEVEALAVKLEEAKNELAKCKDVLNEFKEEEKKLAKTKVELDQKIQEVKSTLKQLERHRQQNINSMEALVLKDIPEEEVPPLAILPEEEIEALNLKELEHKLAKYEKKLHGESPNLNILEEYNKKIELFLARVEELDAVTARRDKFRDALISTTAQRLAEFMEGFAIISSKLKEMFRMISMGGDAELDLVDSTDPFSSGVQFSVRPARKTWKKISNLSGGEKTLSSLALIFALHYFKPSPFYVMDEIDAALDFKNVSIIANYIKDRTKFTQFIIISLRSNMFELADSLLGVYKVDNMSYSIHIGVTKMLSAMKNRIGGDAAKALHGDQALSSQPTQRTSTDGAPSTQLSSQATQRTSPDDIPTQPTSSSATSSGPQPLSSSSTGTGNVSPEVESSPNELHAPGNHQPTQQSKESGDQGSHPSNSDGVDDQKSVGSKSSGEPAALMPDSGVPPPKRSRGPFSSSSSGSSRGPPLFTSTPIRKETGARRASLEVDHMEGIVEEGSREIQMPDNDGGEESDSSVSSGESRIVAGQDQGKDANFDESDFEFENSDDDDDAEKTVKEAVDSSAETEESSAEDN